MGKLYKGFSKEEHAAVSQEITDIRKRLLALSEKIIPAYGVSSAVGKEIESLVMGPDRLILLKQKLENAYLGEHGKNDNPY